MVTYYCRQNLTYLPLPSCSLKSFGYKGSALPATNNYFTLACVREAFIQAQESPLALAASPDGGQPSKEPPKGNEQSRNMQSHL